MVEGPGLSLSRMASWTCALLGSYLCRLSELRAKSAIQLRERAIATQAREHPQLHRSKDHSTVRPVSGRHHQRWARSALRRHVDRPTRRSTLNVRSDQL